MASRADSKLPLAACAVGAATDWKHIPHGGRKESAMKRKVSGASGVPTHIPQAGIGGGMSENQIVVYQPNETLRLDVRLENETVWLNQSRLGELFGVDRTVVNRHIHNIYKTGELEETATCAKIAQVQNEGGRTITRSIPFYNLDVIIAVGYRVNSFAATQFRRWATNVLKDYLLRGYAVNQRLNQLEDKWIGGYPRRKQMSPN